MKQSKNQRRSRWILNSESASAQNFDEKKDRKYITILVISIKICKTDKGRESLKQLGFDYIETRDRNVSFLLYDLKLTAPPD